MHDLIGQLCEFHRPGHETMIGIIFRVNPDGMVHLHLFGAPAHATTQATPYVKSEKDIPADGIYCCLRARREQGERKEEEIVKKELESAEAEGRLP